MGINKKFSVMSLGNARIFAPEKVGYSDSVEIIREELLKTKKSFIKIGWYLKHIQKCNLYSEDGYQNIYDFAFDKFNLTQPTATRFMQVCEEFSKDHDSPELDDKYADYSVSQLFEMLPMTEEQKEKVTPATTVRQMRQIKKNDQVKVKENKEPVIPEEIIPGQTSIEKDFPEYMPNNNDDSEIYTTSYKDGEEYIEGEYQEIKEKVQDQWSELMALKNNDQRKAWLAQYKKWGLWYYDGHIDVNYYKYDFPDGSRLIVTEYPQRYCYWKKEQEDQYYFHLLEKKSKGYGNIVYDKQYVHNTDSETYLLEFLKGFKEK